MKKIIIGMLVAAMFVSMVNAGEIGTDYGSTTTSTVYYHDPSRYIVTIPARMVVTDNETYPITPTLLDLCPGDEVIVTVHGVEDGFFSLTTETGKTAKAYIGSANYDGRLNDGDVVARFSLEDNDDDYIFLQWNSSSGPGNYFGTLTFEVSLNEEMVIW